MPTGIHDKCLPSAIQTDKLANLKAKQLKAAGTMVIKPFPYVEITSFAPTWAAEGTRASTMPSWTTEDEPSKKDGTEEKEKTKYKVRLIILISKMFMCIMFV